MVDLNPLLFKAQSPVEFCPKCAGREVDFIAVGKGSSTFKIAVIGAESGADPEGANEVQRHGARAAQGENKADAQTDRRRQGEHAT